MCLNHPKTIPPGVCGKIVFHETSPSGQKGWGPLEYSIKNGHVLELWKSYHIRLVIQQLLY